MGFSIGFQNLIFLFLDFLLKLTILFSFFQTSSEKIQSAQYGLVLLEEKESLESRCEELETIFEATRHELMVAQEALTKFQSSQVVR